MAGAGPRGERPARAGVVWQCAECPQVLGTIEGAVVTIRHQKRQIKATLPCAQVCDRCGALNFRPAPDAIPDGPLDTFRTDALHSAT